MHGSRDLTKEDTKNGLIDSASEESTHSDHSALESSFCLFVKIKNTFPIKLRHYEPSFYQIYIWIAEYTLPH